VERALDASGQVAMAIFAGDEWKSNYHGRPPIRPAVCVGQILQHRKLPDDRYNIVLQGVCRARVREEAKPSVDRLYRQALLEPVGIASNDPAADAILVEEQLQDHRRQLRELFTEGDLSRLVAAEQLGQYLTNPDIPTHAVLEIISFTLIQDADLRYELLAQGSPHERASLVLGELRHLSRLIRKARGQQSELWPKGLSWN
jgi:Lon protease-like protein